MNEAEERFLDALYRGVTDGEALDHALKLLQDMFGCRGAVLASADTQDPSVSFNSTSGWLKENLQLYLEKYAHLDPAPEAIARLPVGTASSTNRIFTTEQLRTGRFYNEFFLPHGMVESLAGNLYSDQGHLAIIAVMRSEARKPFDDDDIAHLERLMPHITRAVQLRRAFFKVDAKSLGLQATVDRLRVGIVLLGENGAEIGRAHV